MNKIERKTGICSISCVMLWQNSENTYVGHFLAKNQDTGWKNSFCNFDLAYCGGGWRVVRFPFRNIPFFYCYLWLVFLPDMLCCRGQITRVKSNLFLKSSYFGPIWLSLAHYLPPTPPTCMTIQNSLSLKNKHRAIETTIEKYNSSSLGRNIKIF